MGLMGEDHEFTANTGNGKAKVQRPEVGDQKSEIRKDPELLVIFPSI
jgi:hypothetical protein